MWAAALGQTLDERPFTDETGQDGLTESGVTSSDRRGGEDQRYRSFLATVHDAELHAIAQALQKEQTATLGIATDSRAGLAMIRVSATDTLPHQTSNLPLSGS